MFSRAFRCALVRSRPRLRSDNPLAVVRRVTFSTTARPATNSSFVAITAFSVVSCGLSYTFYRFYFSTGAETADDSEAEEPLARPAPFSHPYHQLPRYQQIVLKVRRMLFLTVVFIPCTLVSAAAAITQNGTLREQSIKLLVWTLERAGCSFLKFGQWMSMRPDMLPGDVVEALKSLCDASPEHQFNHTRRMFLEAFNRDIEDVFETFEESPVASGSVAQVHRARLKTEYALPDGAVDVAVKVRHPSVERETFVDLEILYSFCDVLSHFAHVFTVPFDRLEFSTRVQVQIDFHWEAYNLRCFTKNFKKEIELDTMRFPRLSTELLSPGILVETWDAGQAVSDLFSKVGDGFSEVLDAAAGIRREFNEKLQHKKKTLALTVFDLQMKMILRDNHSHGDLHGGNLLYSQSTDTLTVIDAGMATTLGEDVVHEFQEFLISMAEGSADRMSTHLLNFVDPKISPGYTAEHFDSSGFEASVRKEVDKWIDSKTGKAPDGGPISIGDLMGGILFEMTYHGLSLRGDVAGQMITFSISEGLIRQLDPSFDVVGTAKPYLARYGVANESMGAPAKENGLLANWYKLLARMRLH